ncbi:MAG: class I SAM-dependent methyltransferase [Thermoleophilia bacterium]|nr:class I SAM-dependent methyltransferase [Thermoleophilia bacterium]
MSDVDPRLRAHFRIGEPSDERFVEAAFELVLRRPPDPDAREIALSRFADGTLSRAALLHDLVTAPEFDRVRQLDDVIALARGARKRGERPRHLQAPPGTDERLVEVPWVLSRLRSGRVLEVGYAFAEPAYLAGLVEAAPGELVGVDLAVAEVPGFETVAADARELPFPDRSFDQILLVSTLEHIGADNELYGSQAAPDANGREAALGELRRVLRPDGSLLVTVPLGEPGDHGSFRQDDISGWTQLLTRAGYFVEEQEAYELGDEGWRSAPTFEARGVMYGTRGPAASAVLCLELSPRRLRRLVSPDGVRRTARRRLGPRYRRLRGV